MSFVYVVTDCGPQSPTTGIIWAVFDNLNDAQQLLNTINSLDSETKDEVYGLWPGNEACIKKMPLNQYVKW